MGYRQLRWYGNHQRNFKGVVEMEYYPDLNKLVLEAHRIYIELTGDAVDVMYFVKEANVKSFTQTWPSTTLGFEGFGGQSITKALTTVIGYNMFAAVFFNDEFAYCGNVDNEEFQRDMRDWKMKRCIEAYKYKK